MTREPPQDTVTILFTDVVDSTALTERMGDAAYRAAARALDEGVRAGIREAGGTPVEGKVLGDGVMAVFTSTAQAIGAARRCIELSAESVLSLHVGLHAGDVIREDTGVYGGAVNIAARVCDVSAPGEILVSDIVRGLARTSAGVTFEDRGEHALKGIDDPVRIYAVQPAAVLQAMERTPFVRRQEELAQLRAALDRAVAGSGGLVLISGEAGVGKARLAEELGADARRRRLLTFTGHCHEDDGGPPYGPWVEILEAATRTISPDAMRAALGDSLPDVARLLPATLRASDAGPQPEGSAGIARHQMFAGVREFLASASSAQPVVLLLPDLHWADDGTVQLLRHLARTLHEIRALIVVTYRDDPPDTSAALAQALDEWHRKRLALNLRLRPFSEEEVQALLQAVSGHPPPAAIVRALHTETGGNAFFVQELLRHLTEEQLLFDEQGRWRKDARVDEASLPHGVRVVVDRRLARLSEGARDLLSAAAILGRAFDADLIERVAQVTADLLADAVDEAESAGIVVPEGSTGERWRFAHPLTRRVIVERLTSSKKRRLHLCAAEGIEEVHGGTTGHAPDIAYHYQAAGRLADPAHVVAALRAAGDHAENLHANVEAAAYYAEALRIAETRGAVAPLDLAGILHRYGHLLGPSDRAREPLDRALEIYRGLGEDRLVAEVLFSKAALCTFEARGQEALEHLAAAQQHAGNDRQLLARILELEAQNLVQLRQYVRARQAVNDALAVAAELDDTYTSFLVHLASGYLALSSLDMPRAVEDFAYAQRAAGASYYRMAAQSRAAIALACIGELDEAEARSAEALAYFRSMDDDDQPSSRSRADLRDPYEFGMSCVSTGVAAIARGRFEEALALLQEALESGGGPPNIWVVRTSIPMIVQIHHYAGRFDEAKRWVQRYLVPADGSGRLPAFPRLYLAVVASAQGDRRVDGADLPAPPPHMPDLQSLAVTVLAAEAAVALQDAEVAARQLGAIQHMHDRGMRFTSGWVVLVPRLLGSLLALRGEHEQARQMLDSALRVAETTGATTELARTHLEIAALPPVDASGRAMARAHLADARRLLTGLGMRAHDGRLADVAALVD